MKECKLSEDLSTLTTISSQTFDKLAEKVDYCICDNVEELILSGDELLKMDIGIGNIYISVKNGELKYHFEPSAKLNVDVLETIKNKKNILTKVVENTLIERLTNTYKDLL